MRSMVKSGQSVEVRRTKLQLRSKVVELAGREIAYAKPSGHRRPDRILTGSTGSFGAISERSSGLRLPWPTGTQRAAKAATDCARIPAAVSEAACATVARTCFSAGSANPS